MVRSTQVRRRSRLRILKSSALPRSTSRFPLRPRDAIRSSPAHLLLTVRSDRSPSPAAERAFSFATAILFTSPSILPTRGLDSSIPLPPVARTRPPNLPTRAWRSRTPPGRLRLVATAFRSRRISRTRAPRRRRLPRLSRSPRPIAASTSRRADASRSPADSPPPRRARTVLALLFSPMRRCHRRSYRERAFLTSAATRFQALFRSVPGAITERKSR